MRFRKRRTEFEHLEAALRAQRPEPSDELVRRTSVFLANARGSFRLPRLRLALVGMLTVSFLAVMAAFGGLSVAASSANSAKSFLTTGSFSNNNSQRENGRGNGNNSQGNNNSQNNGNNGDDDDDDDPDDDQYEDDIVICHRPPGNPDNARTLRLSPSGAQNHLDNHEGDTEGPCPDDD
jgi:hypothetical protein